MTLGTEWLIDASGCDADALADLERLRAVFDRVINDLELNVVGEIAWTTFSQPGGVSGLALLSESHLTCHTYPEFGAATFNLYCCRKRTAWPWEKMLREMLGAKEVRVQVFERMLNAADTMPALEEAGAPR
ncbi:MAG TPA: S-adenosylmethionine decarboxylase [Pyrinomonadaceae bacterium]|jgi:S-adenosylmethionine decarboxylase|nr:S-adenosylmethionine decarboxylase [Pyrinomonadaceae bacterium]